MRLPIMFAFSATILLASTLQASDTKTKVPNDAALVDTEWVGTVVVLLKGKRDGLGDVRMIFTAREGEDFAAEYWVHDGKESLLFKGKINQKGKIKIERVEKGVGDWKNLFINNLTFVGELTKDRIELRFSNRITGHTGEIKVKLKK